MRSKTILSALLFGLLTSAPPYIFSQGNFYIPFNVKKAYENRTRSADGSPGENYWQNSSKYKIKVSVNPAQKLISGEEEIEYSNNSPDTLKEMVIRLYQNIYKPGSSRDFLVAPEDLTEGITISKFIYNNMEIPIEGNINFAVTGTNLFFLPDHPLLPHSKTKLKFEWSFKISSRRMRMGIADSTSFFIGYWYPQVSVYDDIDGWDKIDYTGTQEFYNDYSDYEVEISVPNRYAVWGTGIHANPEKIFTEEYLNRYREAHASEKAVKIIAPDDLSGKRIFNDREKFNTWIFKAENVTDFSFALSDHYLWDALALKVGRNPEKTVFISAAYKKESLDFYEVAVIAKKSVIYFSDSLPGIVFPYPSLTIFNGGGSGGMEYPMMVNDASFLSIISTLGTTSHEIAHQYFPFYVGTNERKYAFMDEGMAVMLPMNFQETSAEGNFPRQRNTYQYESLAGRETDMPPMIPSVLLKSPAYRIASYNRPGLAYYFLREAVGKDLFDKALHEFIHRWNGKHPIPYDFFNTFNSVTRENLDWFWLPWFFERAYPDLRIKTAEINKRILHVVIEKKGAIPVPIKLTIAQINKPENGYISSEVIYKTATAWKSGETEYFVDYEIQSAADQTMIILGSPDIPDVDKSNNTVILDRQVN